MGQLGGLDHLTAFERFRRKGMKLLVRRRNVCAKRKSSMRQSGQRHADHAFDDAILEAIACVLGFLCAVLNPACAAAGFVGEGEIFLREGLARAEQFDDCLTQLRTRGPGLVHAGAGEHISRAGAFADACVAVAAEIGLAVAATLFQGFCAPGAQGSVLEVLPQRGVLDVVLQVAIGGARGVVHPRRDEDAHRDQPLRMHVEEAEDLRFRKPKLCQTVPGFRGESSGNSITNFMPRAHSRCA